MNTDTVKQQLTAARNAYKMGSLDIASLDKALDTIEQEVSGGRDKDETKRKPFGNTEPQRPVPPASNTPASPQPSTGPLGNNPVPEQVNRPFHPGGDVHPPAPGQTDRNRP